LSETDSFIQEVTEEVRQDRMFALWKKWGPFVIGGVIVIVGVAAAWSWHQSRTHAAAETRGGAFIAVDAESPEQIAALPEKIDGPARLIAELSAAAALIEADEPDRALAAYQAIAAQGGIHPEYADLAALQAARLLAADGDHEAARSALAALIAPGGPYRLLALELRAAIALEVGDRDAARADLREIADDPDATFGSRERARAILDATGGEPADASG